MKWTDLELKFADQESRDRFLKEFFPDRVAKMSRPGFFTANNNHLRWRYVVVDGNIVTLTLPETEESKKKEEE